MAITSFTDLDAWKEAHKLVLFVYKQTKLFPDEEKFGLISQMRRASVSITSNIAEGFGRHSAKDKANFYTMAKTSLAELQNQFLIAQDLGYVDSSTYSDFDNRRVQVDKLLAGLIKSAATKLSFPNT